MKRKSKKPALLTESQIEAKLVAMPELAEFFRHPHPLVLIRGRPVARDPVYEIQLAFDLGDRMETWRWLWIDALEGRIVRQFPG